MAGGGWSGTQEAWDAVERPLPSLDPVFQSFAQQHGFVLTKNSKDWPERSLLKLMPLPSLIQVFRIALDVDAWKVGVICTEDRGNDRYWKQALVADAITGEQLGQGLAGFLEEGRSRLVDWNADTRDFAFATRIIRPTSWL